MKKVNLFFVILFSVLAFVACQKDELFNADKDVSSICMAKEYLEWFSKIDTIDSVGIVHTNGFNILDDDCNVLRTVIVDVYIENDGQNSTYRKEDDGWYDENGNPVDFENFWWYENYFQGILDYANSLAHHP